MAKDVTAPHSTAMIVVSFDFGDGKNFRTFCARANDGLQDLLVVEHEDEAF